MALVRGVTVLDLIADLPPGAQGFLPDPVARFVDLLNIAEVRTRSSTGFFVHEGRVQSATEAGLDLGTSFPVEIPGLNAGLPFQLAFVRQAAGPDNDDLEGEPDRWLLDLFLDRVAVVIPPEDEDYVYAGGGGCSTSGGNGSWLLLLGAAALVRRRKRR